MKMMSVLCVLCTLWSKTFNVFTDLISALKLLFLNKMKRVEGHHNPGLFNPNLQPRTFQLQTFQP